ncbi:MAG: glycosyltransferase, partial [Cyclobacteriaceae bacterium]
LKSLFNIVDSIEGIRLVIIGNRPRFYEVKSQVEGSRYKDKVLFHEFMNKEKLGICISSADIGLVHVNSKWKSHRVAIANRFMEYSLAALPVICNQGANSELGAIYGHALFYDDSPEQLKKAIIECLADYENIKFNARQIRDEVNWEIESKKLLEVYR